MKLEAELKDTIIQGISLRAHQHLSQWSDQRTQIVGILGKWAHKLFDIIFVHMRSDSASESQTSIGTAMKMKIKLIHSSWKVH